MSNIKLHTLFITLLVFSSINLFSQYHVGIVSDSSSSSHTFVEANDRNILADKELSYLEATIGNTINIISDNEVSFKDKEESIQFTLSMIDTEAKVDIHGIHATLLETVEIKTFLKRLKFGEYGNADNFEIYKESDKLFVVLMLAADKSNRYREYTSFFFGRYAVRRNTTGTYDSNLSSNDGVENTMSSEEGTLFLNSKFRLIDNDKQWSYQARKDNYITFRIQNSEMMRIKSTNGSVGIGTTMPYYKFNINGFIRATQIEEFILSDHVYSNKEPLTLEKIEEKLRIIKSDIYDFHDFTKILENNSSEKHIISYEYGNYHTNDKNLSIIINELSDDPILTVFIKGSDSREINSKRVYFIQNRLVVHGIDLERIKIEFLENSDELDENSVYILVK